MQKMVDDMAEYYGTTKTMARFLNGILQKGNTVGRGRKVVSYVDEKGGSPTTEASLLLRKKIEAQMAEMVGLDPTFNEMTVALMQKRKVTVAKLADDTGLSEDTIKNFRNRTNIIFPIQEIVAVCIFLRSSAAGISRPVRRSFSIHWR